MKLKDILSFGFLDFEFWIFGLVVSQLHKQLTNLNCRKINTISLFFYSLNLSVVCEVERQFEFGESTHTCFV